MQEQVHYLGIREVSDRIRRRAISSEGVVEAELQRIEALEPSLKSFSEVLARQATEQARRADSDMAQGLWRGPLHGVPLGVKDIIDVEGAPTSCGGTVMGRESARVDADVVRRLRNAGAIIIGKTHMTEGASLVHHPLRNVPDNPWKTGYWAGVSSSGSGSATAAGLCFGALGTDTGGSIRMPSAACGLSGLKPTWGRVSRHGVFPMSASFDHVGPMARSVEDAAIILEAIAGRDDKDPTSLTCAPPDYVAALGAGVEGLRIGIDRGLIRSSADAAVAAAFEASCATFSKLGADLVDVVLPPFDSLAAKVMPFLLAEAAVAHARYYPKTADEYGPHLSAMLDAGWGQSALDVAKAVQARAAFRGDMQALFAEIDVLLIPTLPCETPSQRAMTDVDGDLDALLNKVTLFTFPVNVADLPALTFPGGFGALDLPIGMQLIGAPLQEAQLLNAGHAFQCATQFHMRHPAI